MSSPSRHPHPVLRCSFKSPPRTHLQIVGEPELKDGASVITLRPTAFQNMHSIEQVHEERKLRLQQLASGLVWNMRNQAELEKRQ